MTAATASFRYRETTRDGKRAGAASPGAAGRWAAFRGAGGIGFYDDELVVIDLPVPGASGDGRSDGRAMAATARPLTGSAPLEPGGVFALRHFALHDADDWDEFLSLSVDAWPTFEADHGCTIEGLFRFEDQPADALLVTRYPSVAGWESSRSTIRPDDPAGRNFLRRRELTRRSVVRIAGSLVVS